MAGFQVLLEDFEGPLDVLVYIIQKNHYSVYNVPISELTDQYLKFLDTLKDLNLEVAGEFLSLASTLMRIKARSLLPQPLTPEEVEERTALMMALEERLKELGTDFLARRAEEESRVWRRDKVTFDEEDFAIAVNTFDLAEAFRRVLEESRKRTEVREIPMEEVTIEQMLRRIRNALEGQRFLRFQDLFRPEESPKHLILLFMALLELMRLGEVACRQNRLFGEIRIYRTAAAQPSAP